MTSGPSNRKSPAEKPEFDSYATGYAAGMDNSVKALMGASADDFLAVKLGWLLRAFPELGVSNRRENLTIRLLDYGCGTAALLRLIARRGLRLGLAGCDISDAMLAEGAGTWPRDIAALPELVKQDGARVDFPDARFDFIIISAVLHHVPPKERGPVYAELNRVLRPGGCVVVFEHNPLNPVTRLVVARTPIDRNAILLRASEVVNGLCDAGFATPNTSYLMFAPPRLGFGAGFDAALRWLPLGAQYAVTARRRA